MERPHLKDKPLPVEGGLSEWALDRSGCSWYAQQEGSVRETVGGRLLAPGRTGHRRGPACIISAGWGSQEMTHGHRWVGFSRPL